MSKSVSISTKSFYPNNDTVASMFSRLKNETDKMRQDSSNYDGEERKSSSSPIFDPLEDRVRRMKHHLRNHLDLHSNNTTNVIHHHNNNNYGSKQLQHAAMQPLYASDLLRAIGETLAQQNKIHEALLYTRASWEMKQGIDLPGRTLIRNLTRLAELHLQLNEPKMAVLALMDALPLMQRAYGYDSRQVVGIRKQISTISNQQRGWSSCRTPMEFGMC